MTETETLNELRDLHRSGTPATALGLSTLFEVMARGTWASKNQPRSATRERWVYDRHRHASCGPCSCPPRSAGPCQGPNCPATIVSVREQPPAYCSGRCRSAADTHQRTLIDLAVHGLLMENRAGLPEHEIARRLRLETDEIRRAEERINREIRRITRTQRTDPRRFDGITWHLALAD